MVDIINSGDTKFFIFNDIISKIKLGKCLSKKYVIVESIILWFMRYKPLLIDAIMYFC